MDLSPTVPFHHGLQHRGDAFAESANFRFNLDASTLLLRQRRAFSLGPDAFRDVVVRADPISAAFNGTIDDQNGTPVRRFDNPVHRLTFTHRSQDFGPIFFRVDIETARFNSILDQVHKRAAWFYDIGRQAIHFDIAIIADEDALAVIEHDDPLRHVVEGHGQHRALADARTDAPPAHERKDQRSGTNGAGRSVDLPALFKENGQGSPAHPICEVIVRQAFIIC